MTSKSMALSNSMKKLTFYQDVLNGFIKIQSVSSDSERKDEMVKAAQYLSNLLLEINVDHVKIIPTEGHPVVYAEKLSEVENAKTILIYGHYDVQPEDPLELWKNDPFSPVKIGDRLYGRGASDMKGQVIATLAAVDSINSSSEFPLNFKFIFEGEEEIGSPSLIKFVEENKDLLACDVILNPDAGMISPDCPTIVYGLRGLAYFELIIKGPDHDLHSGMYGGVIHNPAIVMADLISRMHDKNGRIKLPGFYDDVLPLEQDERDQLNRLPVTEQDLLHQTSAPALWGEKGYSHIERMGARPTLDINGMVSGFVGEGQKTIIPSYAMAKISMRTVPNQDPDKIHQQLVAFIKDNIPETVDWELNKFAGGWPSIADRNNSGVLSLSKAFENVWGVSPLFKREGGSISVVPAMQTALKRDSILTGFGLPDDKIHSPNESLHIPTWEKGIRALIEFFYIYAGIG